MVKDLKIISLDKTLKTGGREHVNDTQNWSWRCVRFGWMDIRFRGSVVVDGLREGGGCELWIGLGLVILGE